MSTKQSLREGMKFKLLSHSPWEIQKKSRIIRGKLLKLNAFQEAICVCFYVSLPTEVDTLGLIDASLKAGKRVVVPLSDLENKELKLFAIKDRKKDLRKGPLGILEPIPSRTSAVDPREVDCVVVPGLAFDAKRHRVGRGKGFYDRWLTKLRAGVPKIGLAFSFQVVSKIPQESHDKKLDFILTES